jgi:hypothetical protein
MPGLAPCSAFAKACKNTPNGEGGGWIIPWDQLNKDFIYTAIDDSIYRGYMTAYDLKTVVDMHLTPKSFTVTSEYSCFVVYAYFHFLIGIVFMMLACLIFWNPLAKAWFNGGYWWLFLLTPVAFLVLISTVAMFLKRNEDKKTLQRNLELYKALNEANDLFLKDTNLRLQGGDYGAWIELVDEDIYRKSLSRL